MGQVQDLHLKCEYCRSAIHDARKEPNGRSGGRDLRCARHLAGPVHKPWRDSKGRNRMNWVQIENRWKEFAGSARARWSKLTDDDWHAMTGTKGHLIGRIQ